jgi:stage III sporulation protein SpoIIIAA
MTDLELIFTMLGEKSTTEIAKATTVSTLAKIMVDVNAPASTRVRAADSIINHTSKAIEIEDIEARVGAIEEAAGKIGGRR